MNAKAIGNKLIELRGEKTREEVAKACNTCVSAIAMYERGERIPKDEIKITLARYYGTTVGDLFYFEKNDTKCVEC